MGKFFLLIDDDIDDAEMFGEALLRIEAGVTYCHVRDDAGMFQFLGHIQNQKPDIIFLDVNMPKISGWECLNQLKSHTTYHSIPVIMYSTSSLQEDKDLALQSGASGFLTKANDFMRMVKTLEIIVNTDNDNLVNVLQTLHVE